MDYSSANTAMWNAVIQLGIIAASILLANLLRRKVSLIQRTLIPTVVLAGFILLLLKSVGLLSISSSFFEYLTYHGIAIGFIAMSLRIPEQAMRGTGKMDGVKSGALIASTYVFQGILGLAVTLFLSYTFFPDLFRASGILLPMGYGQGPGQANNIGGTYESLGFVGGRSFALSLAAAGYLCACIIGVIYVNVLRKKGIVQKESPVSASGDVTIDTFQDKNEIPISESIDKFSMQVVLVITVYFLTYLLSWGLTSLVTAYLPGLSTTILPLLWGFNFVLGSLVAILTRTLLTSMKKLNYMKRQYQNNYLLNRISGLAFDIMIVCGIASINIEDLSGLWIPFLILAVLGGIATLGYLIYVCKKIYPGYYFEGMLSMYGMMTGTISSGVLLLREVDPNFKTPAANNLVIGSSYAILFGAPILALVGMAPKYDGLTFLTLGLLIIYLVLLLLFLLRFKKVAQHPSSK